MSPMKLQHRQFIKTNDNIYFFFSSQSSSLKASVDVPVYRWLYGMTWCGMCLCKICLFVCNSVECSPSLDGLLFCPCALSLSITYSHSFSRLCVCVCECIYLSVYVAFSALLCYPVYRCMWYTCIRAIEKRAFHNVHTEMCFAQLHNVYHRMNMNQTTTTNEE